MAAEVPAALDLTGLTTLAKQVQPCLALYGSHITTLRLESAPGRWLAFTSRLGSSSIWQLTPFLQELHLRRVELQFTPDAALNWRGAAYGLSRLRKLTVSNSTALGGDVGALAALTTLEHLSLDWCHELTAQHYRVGLPDSFLDTLQHLTLLQLFECTIADHLLQQLSRLQELRILGLDAHSTSSAAVEGLSSAFLPKLTALQLIHLDHNAGPSQDRAAQLVGSVVGRFPGLKKVSLTGRWRLQPQLLAPLTLLQHLDLSCKPFQASGHQHGSTSSFLEQLLGLVSSLQHVLALNLSGRLQHVPGMHSPEPWQYGVLTACSCLQQLHLRGCTLPVGAFSSMFPMGRVLPDLEVLVLHDSQQEVLYHTHWVWFTSCCPNLEILDMSIGPQPPYDLHALRALTSMRQLTMAGASDAAVTLVLASLSGLTSLQLLGPNSLTRHSLQALKQATFLDFMEVSVFVPAHQDYINIRLAAGSKVCSAQVD